LTYGQAGLFSAVCAAFIIQIQPDLKPDPNAATQALLYTLIQATNASALSGNESSISAWNGPTSGVVVVESMLYASLFVTLLAAFLAMLSKQWLAYYASVGMKGTIAERGLERQRKFDGFRKWGFESMIKTLPILLQLSLLLFAAALTIYLWSVHRTIAVVTLSLGSVGLVFYLFFSFSPVFSPDSPFRTPLSAVILTIYTWFEKFILLVKIEAYLIWVKILLCSRMGLRYFFSPPGSGDSLESFSITPANRPECRDVPLFQDLEIPVDDQSLLTSAIIWTLEASTDPAFVASAASAVMEIQQRPQVDLTTSLIRLRDTFTACFQNSRRPPPRSSAERCAIACGRAYYRLFFYAPKCSIRFPATFFENNHFGPQHVRDWSTDLELVYDLLESLESWQDPDIDTGLLQKSRAEVVEQRILVSLYNRNRRALRRRREEIFRSTSRLVSAATMHVLPHRLYFGRHLRDPISHEVMEQLGGLIFELERVDSTTATDWLLCLGIYCEVPIHPHDLVPLDKRYASMPVFVWVCY
jgi:Family of unknown function (DUF6535)